jgi:hypothetical protein
MIFRRERCKQTIPSALVGVSRCHSHVPRPTGEPNDRRDEKAGAPISASTGIASVIE